MTDPNDMEDPQAGEILPPILYEAWWSEDTVISGSQGGIAMEGMGFKRGMEFCFVKLLPLLKAALPYYEAGVMDTRTGQADAGKLAELAQFKGIVEYEK